MGEPPSSGLLIAVEAEAAGVAEEAGDGVYAGAVEGGLAGEVDGEGAGCGVADAGGVVGEDALAVVAARGQWRDAEIADPGDAGETCGGGRGQVADAVGCDEGPQACGDDLGEGEIEEGIRGLD